MSTYAIGDIHGSLKGLQQCLKGVNFDNDNDTLIQTGDIVDRMPESFGCVEELLKIKNLIAIKGNHDDWFLEFIEQGEHGSHWLHGGKQTLQSYCNVLDKRIYPTMNGYVTDMLLSDIPESHRNFFKNQINYYILDRKLFVHGGFNRHLPINKQQIKHIYYWDRDLWLAALSFESTSKTSHELKFKMVDSSFDEVFIGHTPTINWDGVDGKPETQPMFAGPITNIDTGGGFENGKVTIMDIYTKEYFQSETNKVMYSL